MEKITISQGDSFSFAVVLPPDKMSQVEEVVVYCGNKAVARKSDSSLLATVDANIFHVRLSSTFVQGLSGQYNIIVAVDYSDLGVRKVDTENALILVVKNNNNQFTNDSISTVISATITIVIVDNELTQNVVLATIYRGFSAYEVAVENGFEGTENEWLASLSGGNSIETAATYSAISNSTVKRFIHVVADETNAGDSTFYLHDGVGLQWIVTQKQY